MFICIHLYVKSYVFCAWSYCCCEMDRIFISDVPCEVIVNRVHVLKHIYINMFVMIFMSACEMDSIVILSFFHLFAVGCHGKYVGPACSRFRNTKI